MHELSLAISLVEVACEKASALGDVRVETLHLRLGPLAGVVKEALLFSFEMAAAGTAVEGARLQIEEVPLAAYCPACGEVRQLPSPQRFRCPVCDGPASRLVQGRELELVALEVQENAAPNR